jgi:hypothetical protein
MGKRLHQLPAIALFFLCFWALPAAAQNVTGIWRGYFITDGADNYKFELQIEQSPTKRITGVSYSYLSTVFYGKATLNGYFKTASKSALIQEIKTVELRMAGGSTACIMKCNFVYVKSGDEEFLEGTYTSAYEKTNTNFGIKKGGNCGGGKIFLRKVATSDFYVEPFLREKIATKKPFPPAKKVTPPVKQSTAKAPANNKPVAKATVKTPAKPPVNKQVATAPKKDTVKRITNVPIVKEEPRREVQKPPVQVPALTRARTNELTGALTVHNNEVLVRLYDNGEIDGDTISVYMDNKLVLSNKQLTASPLTLTLKMDEENPEHVLVMVAENLGRIPPNTSLMIVQDGEKRYEVRITSTEQKNAMVRFRYIKK